MYSNTYLSIIVAVVAPLLPKIGVTLGNEELAQLLANIVAIIAGICGLYQRWKRGDVSLFGVRKGV